MNPYQSRRSNLIETTTITDRVVDLHSLSWSLSSLLGLSGVILLFRLLYLDASPLINVNYHLLFSCFQVAQNSANFLTWLAVGTFATMSESEGKHTADAANAEALNEAPIKRKFTTSDLKTIL